MADREDFHALTEQAMTMPGRAHMRPVIEKELLHYDILFSLEKEQLLDQLTFQGGTSLRLCHGAPRFSEDLDFAGGRDFSAKQLAEIKDCIEKYVGRRYGLEIRVKAPAELQEELGRAGIRVDKWRVTVVTAPERRDLPRQRIKIEVASIPAWTREPRSLDVNYEFLPDGYGDLLIMTETLDEIMADKLISLVNTERYVRNRDIWDLRWLKQRGAKVDAELVMHKIKDYRVNNYEEKLDAMRRRLSEIIHGRGFRDELSRFIPSDVQDRTLRKEKFYDFLVTEVRSLLDTVRGEVLGHAPEW